MPNNTPAPADLVEAVEPFLREIDRLERDYGFDRPRHQGQTLILPLSDLLALRAAAGRKLLRPEVAAFALLMELQLQANDHKPGWKNDLPMDLLPRLREEAEELAEATDLHTQRLNWGDAWMHGETAPTVGKEAADVANFAMMIADVCGGLSLATPQPDPRDAQEHWSDCSIHNEPEAERGLCNCGGWNSKIQERIDLHVAEATRFREALEDIAVTARSPFTMQQIARTALANSEGKANG